VSAARARAAVTLAALALTVGGCGQDQGESDAVRSAARSYFAALASGNGGQACRMLTDEVRKQFVAGVAAITSASNCEQALRTVLKGSSGHLVRRVARAARIGQAKVDGDTATVKLSSNAQEVDVRMRKQHGAWRVDQPPST
jgi:fructose/tagatose bisphosphate aldolase